MTIYKTGFEQLLRSFCATKNYGLRMEYKGGGLHKYTFDSLKTKKCYVHYIHEDDFRRTTTYNMFIEVTDSVVKEIGEGDCYGGHVYLSNVDHCKMVIDTKFSEYCKADVKATMRMSKFFDPDKTPEIKDVIFNYPATIVLWADGTKTVVKAQDDDVYDPEKGLAMAICKKIGGNKWSYYNKFKHWLKKVKPEQGDYEEVSHITKVIKED